jgi:flagellar motor switch protein FliN
MTPPFEEYLNTWLQSTAETLGQIAGETFQTGIAATDASKSHFERHSAEGVWLRFSLGKRLQGQHAFLVSSDDAVRLAQMLLGDASGGDDLTPDYRDALEEMFRQFAGAAASALKKNDQEVTVHWEAASRPEWTPAEQACLRLSSPHGPIVMGVAIDATLLSQLDAAASAGSRTASRAAANSAAGATGPRSTASSPNGPSPAGSAPLAAAATAGVSAASSRNLDLLMDVQLQVTLRFGERQLLLKEVLDLSPGSVVELDKMVKDPAELLVTGRVVARGEVVIVDGNYGLRITEVAPANQRVEALV